MMKQMPSAGWHMPGGRSLAQGQGGDPRGPSLQSKCRASMLIGFLPMQHRYSLPQGKKAAGPGQQQAFDFSSEPAKLARLGSRRPCLDDSTSKRAATFSAGVRVTSNHAAHLTTTTVNSALQRADCVCFQAEAHFSKRALIFCLSSIVEALHNISPDQQRQEQLCCSRQVPGPFEVLCYHGAPLLELEVGDAQNSFLRPKRLLTTAYRVQYRQDRSTSSVDLPWSASRLPE